MTKARLETESRSKLCSAVQNGSYALHADGMQSYREWFKLSAATIEDIDTIVAQMIEENERKYNKKFNYRKAHLSDPRVLAPGANAPAWWKPESIGSGYSLVTDEMRSGAFLIDLGTKQIYFINAD